MNLHQRQEQSVPTISGRKISNYFTCTVKEVRRLSPQLYDEQGRERTFETDSFKQILTKRSACPANKENLSTHNKALRRIKEEANKLSSQEKQKEKKKLKSNPKKISKKTSTVSLTKLFERNRSANELRKKETKSVSPSKDVKDYRSGPVEKKNYLSNNISSKTREVAPSRSEKSLTDRVRNPAKSVITMNKKEQKKETKEKKDLNKTKKPKTQNKSQANTKNLQKTESIAKQFDSLLKTTKNKTKKTTKKKSSKQKQKPKKSKSKEKKVVVSQNNSKNFISKNKMNSYFSDQSPDSVQKGVLSTRYQNQRQQSKKKRLSFEPTKKKGKSKEKAKTEALSPQKSLVNKNEAATTIQKIFRGYLTRKYIREFKKILLSVITIQKMWRGYKARKETKLVREEMERKKKEELRLSKLSMIGGGETDRKLITPRQNELASLLEEILNEQNINLSIKNKISNFLKKQQKASSSKTNSAASHLQQEMKSQKRYFEQIDRKKYKFGSPLIQYSPKLERSDLKKSPEVVIDNLIAIKQFQRDKLITNAKLQLQGLESLTMKNIFSPRTRDVKKVEIHRKLEEDLQKFQESISEVIKTCKESEDIVGPIKPFSGHSTPQRNTEMPPLLNKKKIEYENSPSMKLQKAENEEELDKLNSSQRKLQDLSMQLLQYYEQKTQEKGEKEYQKIDPGYHFIQDYLLSLFQFLRQQGQEYRQQFIDIMRTSRNLQIHSFLKNLNVLTEDSDQDICFKLPMYKYLEQQETQVLEQRVAEMFNSSYKKLQRHQLGVRANLEEIYLKMIVDAVNQALKIERPNHYIFTEASLMGKSNRIRIMELEALDGIDVDDNEPEFSFYFANSMNHIYKWAHFQCGRTGGEDAAQEYSIMELNEMSLKQYLKFQTQKPDNYYDELLEVIVALSNCIFDQIILEQAHLLGL